MGYTLQIKRREGERAGDAFEAVGLGVVIAGMTGKGKLGAAGLHQRGERLEKPAGGELPVAVGVGDGHREMLARACRRPGKGRQAGRLRYEDWS